MTYKEINGLLKEAINQYNRKHVDESRANFHKVLDYDATNPEAHYYLGLTYSREKNYQKAVLHLKNIADMKTSFLFTQQCRMILGYIYYINQEFKRAEYEYLQVLKSNPNIIQVYSALASIYYKLEDFTRAMDFAEKAYSKDNFNVNAKNTYGFFLCDLDIDSERGLTLLKEVARKNPDNPAYLDSLGWAYYKNGDIKSSISFLRRARETSDNLEIENHLNIVLGKKRMRTE